MTRQDKAKGCMAWSLIELKQIIPFYRRVLILRDTGLGNVTFYRRVLILRDTGLGNVKEIS